MPLNITWDEYSTANVTGFNELMTYANSVTGDYFGAGVLVTIWIVIFLALRRFGDAEGFAAASFITVVLAGILRATEQVSDLFFMLFAIMTGISVIILWLSKKG